MGMALKEVIKCPHCGGGEVVYSCEPKCCFNHVCADCRSTFEINTRKTGEFDQVAAALAEEPPSGDPTTGCAACECLKIAVVQRGDETLVVCGKCGAVSKLVIEEFVAGEF
jgi:hypothetical protein